MRLLLVVMGVLFLAACNTSPGPGPDKGTKVETIVAVVDGKPAKGFHAAPPIDDNTIDCDYATISRAATTMGVFGGCGASAQNPDVYFQAREACNPWYDKCADAVEVEMNK